MKMFTKSVKKVVNVSLLCSVSYGFMLEDFFDKLIIWDTFILRDSSTLGTPLVIPWKMCQNLYSDVPSEEDTSLKGTQTVTRWKYVPINAGSVALAGGTPLFMGHFLVLRMCPWERFNRTGT